MARAQGARAQMALGFESVYGTPPASGNFWKVPFVSSTLGSEQPLLNSDLLGFGRDPLAPIKDAITTDGDVVIPLDSRYLGLWLKGLFGDPVTTGASAPYSHEFRSGGWTLPSMAIELGNPDVPSYRMVAGVRVNSISWNMQRSGLVTATVNCIAQGETPAGSSAVGTMDELALTRFGSFNGEIKRNGSLLGSVVSGSVTYTNNLDRVETIRSDGKIEDADPSIAALSGEIVVRFANTTLLDQATAGTDCELSFGYPLDANNSLILTAHSVFLPKPRLPIEGPGGMQATFAWQAALDSVTGRMATVTLVNDMADFNNPA
ncbi:phage tail tube protein [Paenirhodobacter sp. CAU 1674]|uniref:phage tail tube protein n=1 Tax=Paenirhodobacter sp. CAU 1674 TaxID=3032596 RepID=UPI0023DB378C|nr:phage tail tube protein [Paenirhodobacter sp. CAU 1674]MDF2140857.1 phage tail tube protein [Paenirhodobacter sp. CAU 1674]